MGNKPRSTVGTLTEIYTYLRLMYSRMGQPAIGPSNYFGFNDPAGMCMDCKGLGEISKIDVNLLIDFDKSLNQGGVNGFKADGYYLRVASTTGFFDMDKKLKDFTKDELDRLLYQEKMVVKKAKAGGTPYNVHWCV